MNEHIGLSLEYKNTLDYAKYLDENDPLHLYREQFYIPLIHGKESIYFTGNSLGLQPKTTQDHILNELEDWATFGVEGHHHARKPWLNYHEQFPELLKDIVGAKENELVVMNQLTVNLHMLMTSFYRPTKQRHKIICEGKAFPSDQYALASQVKLHGCDPTTSLIEISPLPGEHTISDKAIQDAISTHGDELALVLIGAVNYYSGQVFDMKAIVEGAHNVGAHCGFDLAHAAGNIELKLHDWEVDFACWCSYKYLNSGPGAVSGVFIHEKYATDTSVPRFAGWWGHNKETRFKMDKTFDPIATAEGWQLSNAPILSMAAHYAALEIFAAAGMPALLQKSKKLTDYLFFILNEINKNSVEQIIEIITPQENRKHGCQVSMLMLRNGKEIFEELKKRAVIADWREPNVIRIAPVPLYNSFEDVFRFGEIISATLKN
ncbi:MAG: kynureninase [Ferruginibacter sp.]|nr:kynureninase [Ferruginibacter sp.]